MYYDVHDLLIMQIFNLNELFKMIDHCYYSINVKFVEIELRRPLFRNNFLMAFW